MRVLAFWLKLFIYRTDVTRKKILSTKNTKSTKKWLSYAIPGEMTAIKFAVCLFFVSFVLFVDYW